MLAVTLSALAVSRGAVHLHSARAVRPAAASSVAMYAGMMKGGVDKWEDGTPSFVQTEMRGASMALHTKQQAPKEGKAEAKKVEQSPVPSWQPGRENYLQFLVDSQHVYATLEDLASSLRRLGLGL